MQVKVKVKVRQSGKKETEEGIKRLKVKKKIDEEVRNEGVQCMKVKVRKSRVGETYKVMKRYRSGKVTNEEKVRREGQM